MTVVAIVVASVVVALGAVMFALAERRAGKRLRAAINLTSAAPQALKEARERDNKLSSLATELRKGEHDGESAKDIMDSLIFRGDDS